MSCTRDPINSSLVSQRHHWIHAHRTPRRDVAGTQCNSHQNDRDARERDWIRYAYTIELAGHQPRESKRREYADASADGCKSRAFANDHLQNIFSLRAERHANADFIHALAHQVGNHAVYSNRREQQRQQRECSQQNHGKALRAHRTRHDFIHCHRVVHHLPAVELRHFFANRPKRSGRRALRPDDHCRTTRGQRKEFVAYLHERRIHFWAKRPCALVEIPVLHVAHHADDFRTHVHHVDVDVFPDRIGTPEILVGELLVDHHHRRRLFIVLSGDIAPAQQRNSHRL